MIFENLHRLFRARDRPCLAIRSHEGKRYSHDGAHGPQLREQRKRARNNFKVITAKQPEHRFLW
jgi:hypothetical protein